jgi:hypothetical protein
MNAEETQKPSLTIVGGNADARPSELPEASVFRLDKDKIEELRRSKMLRDSAELVELEPVNPGEEIVGDATAEEQAVFVESVLLFSDMNEFEKELTARAAELVAAAVRKSVTPQDIGRNIEDEKLFKDREEANEFFAMQSRFNYLKAIFTFSLCERFGHGATYGIRTGWKVVRSGYKYKTVEEKIAPKPPVNTL